MYKSLIALTVALSFSSFAASLHVSQESANPTPPYASWATAATNIQDAVDAATAGDEIVVTNGVYASGVGVANGESNRVALIKPVLLRSVNGPLATVIEGYQVPGTKTGDSAIRCVYVTNGATLVGFTLTNGATKSNRYGGGAGGGVLCDFESAVVSNCVFIGNAADRGGGMAYGTANNCLFTGNSAGINSAGIGGGAFDCVLNSCLVISNTASAGGGCGGGTLNRCEISGNTTTAQGGGVAGWPGLPMILNNCILYGNRAAGSQGGGASESTLNNCTVTGNWSLSDGGGAYKCTLNNSVVYYNSSEWSPGVDYLLCQTVNNCCMPIPKPAGPGLGFTGTGNITNEPAFVDFIGRNFRLQSNSPCVNSGRNALAVGNIDFDGLPRIAGGTVDIGAYEFQNPATLVSIAWLQQYGFATDGSADFTDADSDRASNWHEWQAGTDPTNAASLLLIFNPIPSGANLLVTWTGATNRTYSLESSTNLASPSFDLVATNIISESETNTFIHINATRTLPRFYRARVE